MTEPEQPAGQEQPETPPAPEPVVEPVQAFTVPRTPDAPVFDPPPVRVSERTRINLRRRNQVIE